MRKTDIIFECIIAVFIDWDILGIRTHFSTAYTAYHTVGTDSELLCCHVGQRHLIGISNYQRIPPK